MVPCSLVHGARLDYEFILARLPDNQFHQCHQKSEPINFNLINITIACLHCKRTHFHVCPFLYRNSQIRLFE